MNAMWNVTLPSNKKNQKNVGGLYATMYIKNYHNLIMFNIYLNFIHHGGKFGN
jgi:hypothetical protein